MYYDLVQGLVARGHEVTLIGAGRNHSDARFVAVRRAARRPRDRGKHPPRAHRTNDRSDRARCRSRPLARRPVDGDAPSDGRDGSWPGRRRRSRVLSKPRAGRSPNGPVVGTAPPSAGSSLGRRRLQRDRGRYLSLQLAEGAIPLIPRPHEPGQGSTPGDRGGEHRRDALDDRRQVHRTGRTEVLRGTDPAVPGP